MPRHSLCAAVLGLIVVLHASMGTVVALAAPDATTPVDAERAFTAAIARERSGRGLAAYGEQADLVAVARRHAERMAREGRLYHNPSLTSEVRDWEVVGENVGRGASVAQIHDAFMTSSTHRREILSTTFTQVGIGVAIAGEDVWVAEVFRKPAALAPAEERSAPVRASRAPAPASAAPAPPKPALAPAPAPAAAPAVAAPAAAAVPTAEPARLPEPLAVSEGPDEVPTTLAAAPVALRVPVPVADGLSSAVELAAGLLLLVVATQTVTLRRLRLI